MNYAESDSGADVYCFIKWMMHIIICKIAIKKDNKKYNLVGGEMISKNVANSNKG